MSKSQVQTASAQVTPPMPKRTRTVFNWLKQAALDMRTITYGELGEKVGLPPPALGPQLDYIHYHVCIPRGLPWLAALVVNAETRRPGSRWAATWTADGTQTESDAIWRMAVAQVMAYPSWDKVDF